MYCVRSSLVREPHSFLTLVLAAVQDDEDEESETAATRIDRDRTPHRNTTLSEIPIAIADCR